MLGTPTMASNLGEADGPTDRRWSRQFDAGDQGRRRRCRDRLAACRRTGGPRGLRDQRRPPDRSADSGSTPFARRSPQPELASRIRAISIAGQQHGLVALDAEGEPVHDAMLWNDTRSAVDADELVDELAGPHEWARRVGLVPVASFTITKWAWLRRNRPDLARATTAIRLPHDFLTERLTGRGVTIEETRPAPVGGRRRRASTSSHSWRCPRCSSTRRCSRRCSLPTKPPARSRRRPSTQLGLAAGTLVAAGTGDNMARGLEPRRPTRRAAAESRHERHGVRRRHDTDRGPAPGSSPDSPTPPALSSRWRRRSTARLAIDHFAAWLGLDREDVAPDTGVTVLPFLDGERTPNLPTSAGLVYGVRHTTTPQEILLAAYQGAAGSLLLALQRIASSPPTTSSSIGPHRSRSSAAAARAGRGGKSSPTCRGAQCSDRLAPSSSPRARQCRLRRW